MCPAAMAGGQGKEHAPATGARQHTARPVKDHSTYQRSAATGEGCGGTLPPRCPPAHASAASGTRVRRLSPGTRRACDRGPPAPRPGGPDLDAGALRQYSAQPSRREESPRARGRPTPTVEMEAQGGARAAPGTGRSGTAASSRSVSDPQSPSRGLRGEQESAARAERSGAGALPLCPLGGGLVRQGAASVRARCRADGGQERGLAAQPCAGAVQRRRGISRCTDRSAGGCADRRTVATTRARAWGGLDAAEAAPRRRVRWRSRGRRWRGPSARATERPCRSLPWAQQRGADGA